MWLLNWLPDSILHFIVMATMFSGVALYVLGMFISFVPPALPYKEPIKFFAIVLLVAGVYGYGSYDNEMSWRAKMAELEAKVKVSEAQAVAANSALTAELAKRNQVIKDSQAAIKARIQKEAQQIDANCVVSNNAVTILNDAARGKK